MSNVKEIERAELHKTIWRITNDLRGSVDGNTIDLFGNAYEYPMQMYASTTGKSGGEFYAPQEVSERLVRIAVSVNTGVDKVYDPACGSGSQLLDIAANGYNIVVSSYVEQPDESEAVDIKALNAEIARIAARQAELRTAIDAIVADLEGSTA